MLIKFFKSSFVIQYFVLALISVGLWMPGMIRLQEVPVTTLVNPLYALVHPLLTILQPYNPILAFLIVFISGLTLNNILVYHDLTPKNNLLPVFVYILLMSSSPFSMNLFPLILTIPFFTWFLHTIYRINDEPENNLVVFNASMILSVISLIYFPAAFLFFLLWLVLLVFGAFSGRNILITFIGFFLPYLYLAFYYFWTDRLAEASQAYLEFFQDMIGFKTGVDYLQYGIWLYLLFLMLLPAFFKITGALSSYNINLRKKMGATNWFMILASPLIILNDRPEFNLLFLVPASVMIAHYFNLFKRSLWNEIVVLVFLVMVAIHNYLNI